jgi:hypothetical protein
MDPELGMGIEFLPRSLENRQRLQEVIQQMYASPDTVSDVLVEPEGIDWDHDATPSSGAAQPPKSDAEPDPLLELFRTGASLTKGQFLLELEKHQLAVSPEDAPELSLSEPFAYHRREPRISVTLPVQMRAHDDQNHVHQNHDQTSDYNSADYPPTDHQESFPQTTHLIDVSHRGARVGGVAFRLKAGEVVNLVSDGCDARFLIIWVGEAGTPQEGQIGLQSLATD